jgi:D-amino peptidase
VKIYLSADIEGVTGISHWDETNKTKDDYAEFREQMTREVAAACEAANEAGATEIVVKDAHWTGRNLIAEHLPENVRLIRGWSGHPFAMVQEVDESFAAAMLIGYHAAAGSDTNTLAHTMVGSVVESLYVNGELWSEFHLHTHACLSKGVPVVFVSGDQGLEQAVKAFNPSIATLAVNQGIGDSTLSIHPQLALKRIKAEVAKILRSDLSKCLRPMPSEFELLLNFREHRQAYKGGFFPGVEQTGPKQVCFRTQDYFELLRALLFLL